MISVTGEMKTPHQSRQIEPDQEEQSCWLFSTEEHLLKSSHQIHMSNFPCQGTSQRTLGTSQESSCKSASPIARVGVFLSDMEQPLPVLPVIRSFGAELPVSEASRRRSTSSIGSVLRRCFFFVNWNRKLNKIRGKIKHLTQGTHRSNKSFRHSWHPTLEFSSFLCSKNSSPTTGLHGGSAEPKCFFFCGKVSHGDVTMVENTTSNIVSGEKVGVC